MNVLVTIATAMLLIVLCTVGFAYSGLYDVSARGPHSGPVTWILSTTSHASVERRAADIDVPDLADDALMRAGANDFEAMCIGCHGGPGREPAAVGQGLNPAAPNLSESASHMSPAELFWVAKNGIKMTGMPAWGVTHEDDALWPVVAFMTRLPELDADGYRALLASAEGMGHHGSDKPAKSAEGDLDGHDDHDHSH
ncbi:MAG: cytochrome c [Burkholderiales bacterium]|nr:cytochrome c [Burkholderiales bacterium]